MKRTMIILIFLMGALTYTSTAQKASDRAVIKNTIGFGPHLGYYKAKDADEGNFLGGLQGRFRLGPVIGIEGSVEYRAGQEYGSDNFSVKTSFVPVTGSLLLFAPISESFAPYGIAGIGAYYTKYNYDAPLEQLELDDDSDFNMGYHLGFGAEFPFNQNVALHADYRYLFINPDTNEESFEDADFNSNVFTTGLTFYF